MHYIPEDEYDRLCNKLIETIDDDREEFEDVVERYNLTGRSLHRQLFSNLYRIRHVWRMATHDERLQD